MTAEPLPTGRPVESARGGSGLALPDTLHGQLFLLAYDRRRNRVDGDDRWRFGLALRTAMLTDLYMAGHLHDEDGSPCSVDGARPDDPELRAALDAVRATEPTDWMNAVAHGQRRVPGRIRAQLEVAGWLWVQRRHLLGVIPSTRLWLNDHDQVSDLADRVAAALRDAIADRPADERLLAVGLIGALGELPTVFGFEEASRHYEALEHLVDHAIAPITGMRHVIDTLHGAMSANADGSYST
jgi:hypothetical protein